MELQDLKKHITQIVEFKYRGKYRPFQLMAVQTIEGQKQNNIYLGKVGEVRLNYAYPSKKEREWVGFWTNKIDLIRLKE